MRNFIIRRIFLGLFITLFGAMVIYTVIRSLPTSYVETIARQRASSPLSNKTYQEWLDQLNACLQTRHWYYSGLFRMGWKCSSRVILVNPGITAFLLLKNLPR